jgi:cupin 2 domain-containing protein
MPNLLRRAPKHLREEFVEPLARGRAFRIERIVSPPGDASPPGFWYDQKEDEWVAVLSGRATLGFARGRAAQLKAGDWIFLPARRRHRLLATDPVRPTIWLAVFVSRARALKARKPRR